MLLKKKKGGGQACNPINPSSLSGFVPKLWNEGRISGLSWLSLTICWRYSASLRILSFLTVLQKHKIYIKASLFIFVISVEPQQNKVSRNRNLVIGLLATDCSKQHRLLIDFPLYLQKVMTTKEGNHVFFFNKNAC